MFGSVGPAVGVWETPQGPPVSFGPTQPSVQQTADGVAGLDLEGHSGWFQGPEPRGVVTPDRSRAAASPSDPQPDQQTGEHSASTELRPDESGTDGAIGALKLDVQNLGSLVRDLESKVSQTMTGFRDLQGQMSEIVQLLKQSSQQHPQPGIPQPTMRVGAQGQMGAYGFGQPSAGVPPQMSDPLQYRDPWGGGFRPPPPPPGPPPYVGSQQNQWHPWHACGGAWAPTGPCGAEQYEDRNQSGAMKGLDSKFLPQFPIPNTSSWKTRLDEVLGFRDWLESAASWLCLTSNAFAPEIREALVLEQPLMPSHLSGDQRDRSQRVYFLTKQAFAGY